MAGQVGENDVQEMASFTGASADVALLWLARYHSVTDAVTAWFENNGTMPPEIPGTGQFDTGWNESQFHQDRTPYGPENNPSFTIHSEEPLGPNLFNDGMVTRPPSRVSGYGASTGMPIPSIEDQNLQKAMDASLHMTTQENGTIDNDNQNFRRVEDGCYDNSEWTMTVVGQGGYAQEILRNPEPALRKRGPGSPAFLKSSMGSSNCLPALITILHAIPMAREALLCRSHLLPDYGIGKDWWDGVAIQGPKVVFIYTPNEDSEWKEVVSESQRLVAFLDRTERAYGSSDALARIPAMYTRAAIAANFLEVWHAIMKRHLPYFNLIDIFTTTFMTSDIMDTAKSLKHLDCLEITIDQTVVELGGSLCDALEEAVWEKCKTSEEEQAYLESIADVLVMYVGNATEGATDLGVDVPPVFFADRYLKSNAAKIKGKRSQREKFEQEIKKIDDARNFLSYTPRAGGGDGMVKAEDLLATSMEYLSESTASLNLYNQLKAVAERVQVKLQELAKKRESVVVQLKELYKSTQIGQGADEAQLRYTLRGVSTNQRTTYVLVNPSDVGDLMGTDSTNWQWWKLAFSTGDADPVTSAKVSETEVLEAARNDFNRTMLVYASDEAVTYESEDLPSQLLNFVRHDNLAFNQELESDSRHEVPTSKRKADDSDESNAGSELNWGGERDDVEVSRLPNPNPKLQWEKVESLPSYSASATSSYGERQPSQYQPRTTKPKPKKSSQYRAIAPKPWHVAEEHHETADLLDDDNLMQPQEMEDQNGPGGQGGNGPDAAAAAATVDLGEGVAEEKEEKEEKEEEEEEEEEKGLEAEDKVKTD